MSKLFTHQFRTKGWVKRLRRRGRVTGLWVTDPRLVFFREFPHLDGKGEERPWHDEGEGEEGEDGEGTGRSGAESAESESGEGSIEGEGARKGPAASRVRHRHDSTSNDEVRGASSFPSFLSLPPPSSPLPPSSLSSPFPPRASPSASPPASSP